MEETLIKALINAGVGSCLAVLVLIGVYRIAGSLGTRFIDAQVRQAEALGKQAQSMEGLTDALRDFTTRDKTEHREMLVLLRFLAQDQQAMEEVRREHERFKASPGQGCPARTLKD